MNGHAPATVNGYVRATAIATVEGDTRRERKGEVAIGESLWEGWRRELLFAVSIKSSHRHQVTDYLAVTGLKIVHIALRAPVDMYGRLDVKVAVWTCLANGVRRWCGHAWQCRHVWTSGREGGVMQTFLDV